MSENLPQELFLANSLEKSLAFLSTVIKPVLISVAWRTIHEFELRVVTFFYDVLEHAPLVNTFSNASGITHKLLIK